MTRKLVQVPLEINEIPISDQAINDSFLVQVNGKPVISMNAFRVPLPTGGTRVEGGFVFYNEDGSVRLKLLASHIESLFQNINVLAEDLSAVAEAQSSLANNYQSLADNYQNNFGSSGTELVLLKRVIPANGIRQPKGGLHIYDDNTEGSLTLSNAGAESLIKSVNPAGQDAGPVIVKDLKQV